VRGRELNNIQRGVAEKERERERKREGGTDVTEWEVVFSKGCTNVKTKGEL
jgi:hypothetical protein